MNRENVPWLVLFAIVFGVCFTSTSWIASHSALVPPWNLAFDNRIPFIPAAALVYLTITPVLVAGAWLVRDSREYAALAVSLCVEVLVASVFFLLVPQTTAWTRPVVTGWAAMPFTLADTMNLSYNQFPSLHVALAFSAAMVYARRARRFGWLWLLWSTAVAVSTLLMWEHHVVDVGGGLALAAGVMGLVHPRLHRPGVELLCLRECMRFSRRHARYFVIFLAIYLPSLLHWRRYRAVRTGFCAAQWIDDLLDGDRPSSREPLEIVDELLVEMEQRRFGESDLSRILAAFFAEVDEAAQHEFIALVRCMRRDRVRVLGHETWSAGELEAHHHETFSRSVNLMLITARCDARAKEVPSLVDALGWCSVFRDLDDDLRKGLNNVPRGADVESWTRASHAQACITLERSASEIETLTDQRAQRILGIFQRSVEKFARGLAAQTTDGEWAEAAPRK